ncbi:uncharacterized protein BO88DRAFT_337877 [Aspergillus vadensis CBS 113365]|uniref:Uncharacterized protein n=1 Tax=Aspergillus vadensis (strain CBS 113365 / IMI 142717 / IBT 24658) TaxID=1448311 RepID=A0A319C413_ASPVC|nr:hypothetical protein BO88DRAFT_337877 [Aspergillus vadensis CBS 113365]PYH70188.1 hypothetical protein BO88DRAFT_337877 [Aspergillus vadensis CBS 113365]
MEQTQAQPSSSNLKSSPEQSSPPGPAECLTNADEAPNPAASLSEEEDNVSETEHSAVLSRKEEHAHGVQEMERLVNAGGQRWVIDFQEIGERFGRFAMCVVGWMCNWVIADEDWTVLQGLLPPRRSLADHFAEALIHKAIMENVFSNSFQYLDGKTSSKDQAEDKRFASKLQYLYKRFFDTNPNLATLWKEQTHRLANSTDSVKAPGDLSFGRDNAKRLLACAPCLADEMLASEPIGLLLKKRLGRNQVAKRRKELIEIFEASLGLMKDCETRVGGHFKIKRLSELGPLYQCGSSYMIFHLSNGDIVDEMDFEGRKILLVARPTIMYTDSAPSGPDPSCKSVTAIISKASVVLDKGDEAKKSTTAKRRIIMRATCFEEGDVYVNTSEMF